MKNKIIDQLKGFLNTPPLWNSNDSFQLEQFKLPPFDDYIDLDPISEVPSLASNFGLGKRAESFFELVIRHSERYSLIVGNLQIYKEKVTIGEIDFLIQDLQQKKHLHIEVIYKFYVYDPSFREELQRWIGPNRKDSLLQKIEKLLNNQLPLVFESETQIVLESFNLKSEDLEQQVCFKANLFIPKNLMGKQFLHINNKCIAGYWIHYSDFTEKEYGQFSFFAPGKLDWSIEPNLNEEWVDFAEIQTEILELFARKKSPLIWLRKSDQDYERFFVVWWQEKEDENLR